MFGIAIYRYGIQYRHIGTTFSVTPIYRNLRSTVILRYTETYNMAISSILLHYNAKTDFLLVLNESNMANIPSKQLRSYRTLVHNRNQYFSLFKIDFL